MKEHDDRSGEPETDAIWYRWPPERVICPSMLSLVRTRKLLAPAGVEYADHGAKPGRILQGR
jgi:hypothetical protein